MPLSIIDALDAPDLFGPHFRGGASWNVWKVFLRGLYALPMDDASLQTWQKHTGRTLPPAEPFSEAALICGRRAGKSRILALLAVYIGAFSNFEPYLAPGEKATVSIIASDRKQARTIFKYVVGLLDSVAILQSLKGDETGESVQIGQHVVVEVHTASFRAVRGYTLAACLIDECAFLRTDDTSANPDSEIIAAARPGLSSIPGSLLMIASSPYAKRGALYAAFRRYWGDDSARTLVWRGSSLEMNPTLNPDVVARAYEEDAAKASAEYGASWRDDVSGWVTREVVDACTVPGRYELPHISSNHYSAFVDPSGGSSDSMTLAVAHLERDGIVQLDVVREVRPPFSPEAVVTDFCALLKSYGIRTVRGDRYAGEWAREPFRKLGIEYELSEQPRSDLYRDLLPKLNSRQVELLDLPRLTKQLCDLERRTARSGKDSIDHAPGAHDDVSNAAAGALLAAATVAQPLVISDEFLAWSRGGAQRRLVF